MIDARARGVFSLVMASPEGDEMDESPGCVLLAEPEKRFVWTDALGPEFRPNAQTFMTSEITMRAIRDGAKYRAPVRHKSNADRQKHQEMGFLDGRGTCLTQQEDLAKSL